MPNYAIGDVHGCLTELKHLLHKINYDHKKDTLWFLGDLINRGPDSLGTIRFIKHLHEQSNGKNKLLLGNHDIYLLNIYAGYQQYNKKLFAVQDILEADDLTEIINWLRHSNIILTYGNLLLVHAGIPPIWSIDQCHEYAELVEQFLQSDDWLTTINKKMIGNLPSRWTPSLNKDDAIRYTINAFTRMRFCTKQGEIYFATNGEFDPNGIYNNKKGERVYPWFSLFDQNEWKVVFGHWALLKANNFGYRNIIPIDGGCAYNGELIAVNLDTLKFVKVPRMN